MSDSLSTIPEVTQATEPQVVTPLGGADVLVIAETPGQMQTAQAALIAWAAQKVIQVKQEVSEAEQSYDNAIACGVRLGGIKKLLDNAFDQVTYYEKVKAALEAGYCIVPDFPVEIVAIRVSQNATPSSNPVEVPSYERRPDISHSPTVLEIGAGKYVSPDAKTRHYGERETTGGTKLTSWKATEFREIGLPIKFMKPRVLEATASALADKIFDEIAILPARPKKDPLVIGRIIDPKGARLSFLISWFVDSRDL